MAEYIDRKALLREMTKLYNEREVDATMTGNRVCRITWDDAVRLILVAPTIEAEFVLCKDCKHYKQSAVADRKMCFRKDVDGVEVCYDFQPYDSCTYGERKDGGENG